MMEPVKELFVVIDKLMIDAALAEMLELQEKIKPMLKRISETRKWCIDAGSFSTDHYVCSVIPRTSTRLVSLERAIEALGVELLQSHNLIQKVEFSVVSVSERVDLDQPQEDV